MVVIDGKEGSTFIFNTIIETNEKKKKGFVYDCFPCNDGSALPLLSTTAFSSSFLLFLPGPVPAISVLRLRI